MFMIPAVILAIDSEDDRAYMTMLYREYRALMLKIAWTYSKERADVEDIVSESCTSLIVNIDRIRSFERNALRTYIVTTVRNAAIDLCRKHQRANAHFLHVDDEVIDSVADKTSIEKRIELRDEIEQVRNAIHCLPLKEQDVLRLKYQQGMNDREIAPLVGLSESSVRKYIQRAREQLRAIIY